MLETVVWFCLITGCVALVVGIALVVSGYATRGAIAVLVVAVLLFVLALVSAALADDAGDPSPSSAAARANPTGGAWPVPLESFTGHATIHDGPLRKSLCLVRYYPRANVDPGANWWTTCEENRELTSVARVKEQLALLTSWGPRDTRAFAHIPAGEDVLFMEGTAAEQCEPRPRDDECMDGGGKQLLFRDADFQRSWFDRYECARESWDAPADFKPCAG